MNALQLPFDPCSHGCSAQGLLRRKTQWLCVQPLHAMMRGMPSTVKREE